MNIQLLLLQILWSAQIDFLVIVDCKRGIQETKDFSHGLLWKLCELHLISCKCFLLKTVEFRSEWSGEIWRHDWAADDSGHNSAHNSSHNSGQNSGYNSGQNSSAHNSAHKKGQNRGHNSGYNSAHNNAHKSYHHSTQYGVEIIEHSNKYSRKHNIAHTQQSLKVRTIVSTMLAIIVYRNSFNFFFFLCVHS